MLDLGQLKAGEKMFDLGSGDGRIVIMAAQKYHADATGVELDSDLVAVEPGEDPAARVEDGPYYLRRHSEAGLFVGESHYRVSAAGIEYQGAGRSSRDS